MVKTILSFRIHVGMSGNVIVRIMPMKSANRNFKKP